jgi:translation initiation factor 1 (eIF-1/SUI1)
MSDLDIFDEDFNDNSNKKSNEVILNKKITIEQRKRKGKTVTYIYNWYQNKKELKEPLTHIKKKLGKGGSIKTESLDSDENEKIFILIQGARIINDIKDILINNFNISNDNIVVKGVNKN